MTNSATPIRSLGLIHTVPKLGEVFADLITEILPDAKTTVVVDELLLRDTISAGEVTDKTLLRLSDHVNWLVASEVDAVLVTCSSLGNATETLDLYADAPVLRVDRAMAEHALELGQRIGVIATLSTTLGPTANLITETAKRAGKQADVVARVCVGAFEALQAGDSKKHDEIVRQELERLLTEVDVVVLAQASTARVLSDLTSPPSVPVLSSPRLAVESLRSGLPSRSASRVG
jgi:Asp/Glu/hydantoin racemase